MCPIIADGLQGACSPSRTKKADCQAASIGEGADAPCGRTGSMPRQRIQYRRRTYDFPDDFPERLKRFQEESGLSWSQWWSGLRAGLSCVG